MAKKNFKVYIEKSNNRFVGGFEPGQRNIPRAACQIVDPDDFYAVLQFVGIARKSGVGLMAWWKDVNTSTIYPMPVKQLEKLLLHAEWQGVGLVDGRWRFMKTGICFVPTEEAR
jgi:hypothetical protein